MDRSILRLRRWLSAGLFACSIVVAACEDPVDGEIESFSAITAAECLERPDRQVTVVRGDASKIDEDAPGTNHTYDLRGANFEMHPPKRAITIRDNLPNVCIVGPHVVGQQSKELTWRQMKYDFSETMDGDAIRFRPKSDTPPSHMTVVGAWVDNVFDAFEPPKGSTDDPRHTWSLQSSYFNGIRDDVIENDRCLSGEVRDVLVDNSFMFLSTRPSSGKKLNNPSTPVIKIYDSHIHIAAEEPGGSVGKLFKLGKWPHNENGNSGCSPEPAVDVRRTTFRIDQRPSNMRFPEGNYENVTIIWLGEGNFPTALPGEPGDVELITDRQAGLRKWDEVRTNWLDRHGCTYRSEQKIVEQCDRLSEPLSMNTTPNMTEGVWEGSISSSSDDAEERASGAVSLRSSDLELVEAGGRQTVGLRFQKVDIPQGATIISAHLQFTVDEVDTGAASLTIRGQKNADAKPFEGGDGNISQRTKTNASVSWNVQPWESVGARGTGQRSPDLSRIVQEIVNRSSWLKDNAMALIITGNGTRTAESYDGVNAQAASLRIEYREGTQIPSGVVDIRVSAGSDDAEERPSGDTYLGSGDLELVDDGSRNQTVGIRFKGIQVPQGAPITRAYIQFTTDEESTGNAELSLFGENENNASTFQVTQRDISSRQKTSAKVLWRPEIWTNIGTSGQRQRTPDLSNVVQEIVNRSGWSPGNAMAFIVTGTGHRTAESYNGRANAAPLLHVEFGNTGNPGDTEPPTGRMTSPNDGATVEGTILVKAEVSDNVGVTDVRFFVDGESICRRTARPFECRWDTSNYEGLVSLVGTARDAAGNVLNLGPVNVTVENGGGGGGGGSCDGGSELEGEIIVPDDCSTIQAAIDNAAENAIIIVRPGTYPGGLFIGTPGLTLRAEFPSNKNTIINSNSGEPSMIKVEDWAPRVTIRGFRFEGGNRPIALWAYGSVEDNLFINSRKDAISVEGVGAEIRNNRCVNPSDDCIDLDGPGEIIIEKNSLEDAGEDAIEIRNFNYRGPLRRIIIRDNQILGSGEDGIQIIDYDETSNREFIIERNLFHNSGKAGLGIMNNTRSTEDFRGADMPERIFFINNTIDTCDHGISGGDNLIAINNIISNCFGNAVHRVNNDSVVAYTLFFNNGTNVNDSVVNQNSNRTTDPRFTSSGFLLRTDSPAIDSGVVRYEHRGEVVLNLNASDYLGIAPDQGWKDRQ